MTVEVPSSYTVVGVHITTNSTRFTYTGVSRASDEYAYYDFGAGYFATSFYMEGQFQITGGSGASPKSVTYGFTDTLDDWGATTNQCGGAHRLDGTNTLLYDYAVLREGGVSADIQSLGTFALSTTHYFRTGVFSSIGGQYGAVVTQIFSDASRTTLLETIIKARTTAATYRYTIFGQSITTGSAMTITGYDENVTLYSSTAGIDLTTATGGFTQTDPSAHIADYADCIVATTLNTNEDAYHYKDYGASYFDGNYILTGALNVTAFASGSGTMLTLLSLMNTVNDGNNTDDKHCVILDYVSASTYTLKAREVSSGIGYNSSASSTLNTNQPYWIKSWRDTSVGTYGTLYLAIYNDPGMLSQVGSTLSLALHDNGTPDVAAFQYFYPLQSWNTASSRTSTFTIGGITIQSGTPATGYGSSASYLVPIGITVGAKEFSYTAVNRLLNYSTSTHSKVASSDVVEMLRLLSLSAGENPNIIRTFTQLRLLSSSSSTREGGASSAAVNKLLASVTASKVSAGGTSGSLSVKVTITTIGYSGIFLKLISVRFTKANATTGILEPVTGLSPTLKIKRSTDGLSFDHNDKLFKTAAAAGANLTATMLETDPTYYPGTYNHFVQVNDFGAGENIVYQLWVQDAVTGYFADGTIVFRDGVEQFGGMTVGQSTALTTVVNATDTLEASVAAIQVGNGMTIGQFLALK